MPASPRKPKPTGSTTELAGEAIALLKKHATKATLDGMARYAIPSDHALGVAMRDIQAVAKHFGKNHELAAALWKSGIYEARILAAYVDDPAAITAAQMDQWCRDFDNWAICDTVCFALFKRVPHAWPKVKQWSSKKEEFIKRGAFALLWALAGRDSEDEPFFEALQIIERGATDDRNFVKKSVDMALRATGKRSVALNTAATDLAKRLAASPDPTAAWIGKHSLKELTSPAVKKRLKAG